MSIEITILPPYRGFIIEKHCNKRNRNKDEYHIKYPDGSPKIHFTTMIDYRKAIDLWAERDAEAAKPFPFTIEAPTEMANNPAIQAYSAGFAHGYSEGVEYGGYDEPLIQAAYREGYQRGLLIYIDEEQENQS